MKNSKISLKYYTVILIAILAIAFAVGGIWTLVLAKTKEDFNSPINIIYEGMYKFEKNLDENGEFANSYTLAGFSDGFKSTKLENLTLPDSYDGYPVTAIKDKAFSGNTNLTGTITIPASVKTIGSEAFSGCTYLTGELDLSNCDQFGASAFKNCSKIKSVKFRDDIETISESAFYGCSALTRINIPKTVTSIGDNAFINCSSLTYVSIISPEVFKLAKSTEAAGGLLEHAKSVYVPAKIVNDYNNTYLENTVKFFYAHQRKADGIFIKRVYSTIQNLIIEDGVVTGCKEDITDLIIPETYIDANGQIQPITGIGQEAFAATTLLTITIDISNGYYSGGFVIDKGAFQSCESLEKVELRTYTSYNNFEINDEAFLYCENLRDINIPYGTQIYGADTFRDAGRNNDNYTVTISDGSVADEILEGFISAGETSCEGNLCEYAENIVFTGEAGSLFWGVTYDELVSQIYSLGMFVNDIDGNYIFTTEIRGDNYDASAFDSHKYRQSKASDNVFEYTLTQYEGKVGYEVTGLVQSNLEGANISELIIPNEVNGIPVISVSGMFWMQNAGDHLNELNTIIIGNNVVNINPFAFALCSDLQEIVIPDSVTHIGGVAFMQARTIIGYETKIYYNAVNATIDNECSITIQGSPLSFSGSPFIDNYGRELISMEIGPAVTKIPNWLLWRERLTSLTISANVMEIGQNAFTDSSFHQLNTDLDPIICIDSPMLIALFLQMDMDSIINNNGLYNLLLSARDKGLAINKNTILEMGKAFYGLEGDELESLCMNNILSALGGSLFDSGINQYKDAGVLGLDDKWHDYEIFYKGSYVPPVQPAE